MSKRIRLTDEDVIAELRSDSLRNRVRQVVSSFVGECEQDMDMRPIELRRREFEVADELIRMFLKEAS